MKVFSEQPLALPGSANKLGGVYVERKEGFWQKIIFFKEVELSFKKYIIKN